jgi:hypothetical protein
MNVRGKADCGLLRTAASAVATLTFIRGIGIAIVPAAAHHARQEQREPSVLRSDHRTVSSYSFELLLGATAEGQR